MDTSLESDSSSINVDVITIGKNSATCILQTLLSVSSQTYQHINHIIIDGHSSDNTIEVIHDFNHEKEVLIYYQNAVGIANAFNAGISKSYGDLVIFLNSGDKFVCETVVQQIVDSYTKNRWLWAIGETISVSRKGYLKRHVKQHSEWKQELFLYKNPICHQTTIFSRDILNQTGLYDEELSLGMDYDFNIRSSLIANPFLLYFPVSYFDTSGVSSIRVFKGYKMYKKIRNKYFDVDKNRRFLLDTTYLIKSIIRFFMIPVKLFL